MLYAFTSIFICFAPCASIVEAKTVTMFESKELDGSADTDDHGLNRMHPMPPCASVLRPKKVIMIMTHGPMELNGSNESTE